MGRCAQVVKELLGQGCRPQTQETCDQNKDNSRETTPRSSLGSEDACTLQLKFAIVRVDEGKATELLLVDGFDHCTVHWGQCWLLGSEIAVKIVGIHFGFLHTQYEAISSSITCVSTWPGSLLVYKVSRELAPNKYSIPKPHAYTRCMLWHGLTLTDSATKII